MFFIDTLCDIVLTGVCKHDLLDLPSLRGRCADRHSPSLAAARRQDRRLAGQLASSARGLDLHAWTERTGRMSGQSRRHSATQLAPTLGQTRAIGRQISLHYAARCLTAQHVSSLLPKDLVVRSDCRHVRSE